MSGLQHALCLLAFGPLVHLALFDGALPVRLVRNRAHWARAVNTADGEASGFVHYSLSTSIFRLFKDLDTLSRLPVFLHLIRVENYNMMNTKFEHFGLSYKTSACGEAIGTIGTGILSSTFAKPSVLYMTFSARTFENEPFLAIFTQESPKRKASSSLPAGLGVT